jgi:hypothetical protein
MPIRTRLDFKQTAFTLSTERRSYETKAYEKAR